MSQMLQPLPSPEPEKRPSTIKEIIERLIPVENTYGRYLESPTGQKIYEIVKNEQQTESLVATLFCQVITFGMKQFFSDWFKDWEYYVTSHGQGQYSLLIMSNSHKEEPYAGSISEFIYMGSHFSSAPFNFFLDGFKQNILRDRNLNSNVFDYDGVTWTFSDIINSIDENFINDLLNLDFNFIVMEKPWMEYTKTSYPSPNFNISLDGINGIGTAGVCAFNQANQFGCTLSFHVVASHLEQGLNKIFVNGYEAIIVSKDYITDSCFAVFTDQTIPIDLPGLHLTNGPLAGKTPRQYQASFFDGLTTGLKNTKINTWVPEIPFGPAYVQLRVLTTPDTNHGDSGAALIDDEDYVIGFSFMRSALNTVPEYSSWIWAESVYRAHNLIY